MTIVVPMATFIFPDIHGCLRTLKCILEEQVHPTLSDKLVFLGAFIDRGPSSSGTVTYLIGLKQQGYNVVAVRGNHEQMLLDSLYNADSSKLWIRNGGSKTIESYRLDYGLDLDDVSLDKLIPDEHITFYLSMPFCHRISEYLYAVHGGIIFPINEDDGSMQKMPWLRPWECAESIPEGVTVVHGHTPVPLHEVKRQVYCYGSLVNLDAGCVYADKYPGLGFLTCLNLETKQLLYTANIEE